MGLLSSILWELCSAQTTPDAGRQTMDAGPSTPYYKLTGELKKGRTKERETQDPKQTKYTVIKLT